MNALMIVASVFALLATGAVIAAVHAVLPGDAEATAGDRGIQSGGPALRAVVACAGPNASPPLHQYVGLRDCRIVHSLYSGDRVCKDACLGYGTCRDLCPIDAISIGEDGLPLISEDCDGCGLCVAECPASVIRLVPADADYYIRCSSRAVPENRTSFCSSPCVACDVCRLEGGGAGFSVHNGIASINYAMHGNRTLAAAACPTKCIVPLPGDDKKAFHGEDNRLEWSERKHGASDAVK